jgi:hypothetical protein
VLPILDNPVPVVAPIVATVIAPAIVDIALPAAQPAPVRPLPRDFPPGFGNCARLLPLANGKARSVCVCGSIFIDYHFSAHAKKCGVAISGATPAAADRMT